MGEALPKAVEIIKQHKTQVAKSIETVLPESPEKQQQAMILTMAIDGAIVRAHYDKSPEAALELLEPLILSVTKSK